MQIQIQVFTRLSTIIYNDRCRQFQGKSFIVVGVDVDNFDADLNYVLDAYL